MKRLLSLVALLCLISLQVNAFTRGYWHDWASGREIPNDASSSGGNIGSSWLYLCRVRIRSESNYVYRAGWVLKNNDGSAGSCHVAFVDRNRGEGREVTSDHFDILRPKPSGNIENPNSFPAIYRWDWYSPETANVDLKYRVEVSDRNKETNEMRQFLCRVKPWTWFPGTYDPKDKSCAIAYNGKVLLYGDWVIPHPRQILSCKNCQPDIKCVGEEDC